MDAGLMTALLLCLLLSHCFVIQGQVCRSDPGDKVVNMCENSFSNGNSLYLDTARAVNYQGSCTCGLQSQGGSVELQLSVRGNETDCDSTLLISPYIEYSFRCVGKEPITATGKIEPGQVVYIALTKSSTDAKAALCVHIGQISFGGSLSLTCYAGTLKLSTTTSVPVTTPTPTPPPTPTSTTRPSTQTVSRGLVPANIANICSEDPNDKVINMCERNFGSGNSIYMDTTKAVNYQGNCMCQLSAQGGAVDVELSVKGVHADCNATLYLAPFIDYTFNCIQPESVSATGKIEVGQTVYVTLSKASPDAVADLCVHIVQTSFGAGSLSLTCSEGTPKPTTTPQPQPSTTSQSANSSGSGVTARTANITTSAVNPGGSGEQRTNDTNTTTVSVQKPQVIQPVCQSTSGDKVVNMCEKNFGSGAAIYLDTAKAVNYQGTCMCQLSAQGGDVDLQLTVQGAHADCDATLHFSPSIDHTYNCADKTSSNTTGRIESGNMVFLTLTKGYDDVADFCALLAQTSSGGSLSLNCLEGNLKVTVVPPTTSSALPNSTGSEVTKTGTTAKTNSSSLPKSTASSSVLKNTTDGENGTAKDPQQAPLEQSPAHSTIVVSIIVLTVFGIVVLLTIIMVIAKRVRKKSSSNQVEAAPSSANGLINVRL